MPTDDSVGDYINETDSVVGEEIDEVQYGKPDEILYFTNRFEIGHESCYQKLNKVSKVLGAVSYEEFKKAEEVVSKAGDGD